MGYKGLEAPKNLVINFRPSEKQFELWQLLQPNRCNLCGGEIEQREITTGREGFRDFKPTCVKCGNQNIPQVILAGGAAGGGKTYVSCCWIISSCIRFPELRAVIARKTLKSLKESVLNTFKKVCSMWHLEEGVHYKINNLESVIYFWNGSTVTMIELAPSPNGDYTRLGSSEWSIGAVEECNECDEKGVDVLSSRLRWKPEYFRHGVLLLTCNPNTTWVRDRFVQDNDGNPVKLREGEYTCFFTVESNPDEEFLKTYVSMLNKIKDPAVREALRYGNWNFTDVNNAAAYWNFDGNKHLVTGLREKVYDPLKPLIISWDFNVAPFMSTLALQVDYENKKLYVLEEILGRPEDKENNTPALALKISKKYQSERHMGGIIITGDPAGLARSTQTQDGVNNYTIIMDNLHPALHASKRLLSKQPPQKTRLEFINSILSGETGWEVLIDIRCRRFTEDLLYQKKLVSGEKDKSKVTDPKLRIKYEKFGHLSDCLDYAICLLLSKEWGKFQRGGSEAGIATTNNTVYGTFEY